MFDFAKYFWDALAAAFISGMKVLKGKHFYVKVRVIDLVTLIQWP